MSDEHSIEAKGQAKVRRRKWPHAAILAALIVALLACLDLVVQGLLLIRTSVTGGLAVVLAAVVAGGGLLWRIKVKWAQLRGSDSAS